LKPYVLEEAYEVYDAIEDGDRAHLCEELGDLLLQIVFHAQIAQEAGWFSFKDVVDGLIAKLIRRHPHVFGEATVADADEVLRRWEAIKRQEKKVSARSAVEGVPRQLPALRRAEQVQRRAARLGFDWSERDQVIAKLEEEIAEFKAVLQHGDARAMREELGDVLFTLVNLSRFIATDAEDALHATTEKFMRRFQVVEQKARQRHLDIATCGLDVLDALWEEAKREEPPASASASQQGE